MITCDLCQSSHVSTHADKESFTYKGDTLVYDIEYSTCDDCGEEFIDVKQIKNNDAQIREAKKIHDGLLSAQDLRKIRKKLHLTQDQAAVIFGGGPNSFSKYERSQVTQSKSMDRLLRLTREDPKIVEKLKTLVS